MFPCRTLKTISSSDSEPPPRARNDANNANARASDAEHQLAMERLSARPASTDADLKLRLANANDRVVSLEGSNDYFKKQIEEKDAMILEWMHSNEAFKRLAKQYGKKLGVNDEQRVDDVFAEVEDVAEEDPKFSSTRLLGKAKEHRKRDLQISTSQPN